MVEAGFGWGMSVYHNVVAEKDRCVNLRLALDTSRVDKDRISFLYPDFDRHGVSSVEQRVMKHSPEPFGRRKPF